MKRIYFFLAVLTQLVLLAACSEEELVPNKSGDIDGNEYTPYVIPGRPITISADIEQQGSNTRTALSGLDVVWSEGDAFSLMTRKGEVVPCTLEVVLNGKSQGYGIKVGTSGDCYVRYSGIKVTQTKKGWNSTSTNDITSSITSTDESNSNSYKVGIYNTNSKYQYAPAGTPVHVQLNSNGYTIPLVQSSSSSSVTSSNMFTVRLEGVEYSMDGGKTWTSPSLDQFVNGSSWKKSDVSAINEKIAGETVATLEKFTVSIPSVDAGKSSASFSGNYKIENATHYGLYPYSENASIDNNAVTFTMPAEQQYVEGSFGNGANPAVGVLEQKENGDYHISFLNVCGVLKLQLTGDDYVTSIDLEDNNTSNSLNGTASVSVTKNVAGEYVVGAASLSGGTNKLTLNCNGYVQLKKTEATTFYFVVPSGAFASGFTATINTFYGSKVINTTRNNEIHQNAIKAMPALDMSNRELVVPEFNIENDAAAEYLANSTSTLSSNAGNYGQSYFDQSRSYRPDQPRTKEITWTKTANSTLTMATDNAYTTVVLEENVSDKSSYTLRNFVPGNTYYYKVVDGAGTLLTAGALKATGQLRMIAVDKGFNMRDLGGWTGLNGNKVRYEQIYRGASLGGTDMYGTTSDITNEDKAELYRIGMRAQLDLRAATNAGKYSGEYSYHSYSRGATTLTGADFNNTMTDYGAYNQDASVVCDIAWIIYELKQGRPVYFNCRQGADRTGTIAFIIEGLLGCYGSDTGRQMAMDYELTGFSQANLIDNKKVDSSYRGGNEAATNTSKLFYQLLNLSVTGKSFNNLQEKCYYYLNQYWNNRTQSGSSTSAITACIDKDDLDWFVNYMLGITDRDGNVLDGKTKYTGPTWAATGGVLKTIAEQKANVVNYAQ